MSISVYAQKLEELAKQFEERKINYETYIAECNALGEIEVIV